MQKGKGRQRETVKEKPGRKADGTDVQRTGEDRKGKGRERKPRGIGSDGGSVGVEVVSR